MKNINLIYYKILAILFLLTACQNDDLPKGNFNLDAVTVFSGEVAHEGASLIWQAPTGNLTPQNYILNWSPDGVETILESSTTSYEISGLINETNYKFTIQADYGDTGISGVNEIELAPQDELNFRVLPGNEFAIALWETPNRNDISGYTLTWEPNGQEIEIPMGTNTHQITGLTNDVEYTFAFGINFSGGANSNNVQASVIPGEISAFLINVESPMATDLVEFTYNPAYLPVNTAVSWKYDFDDGTTSTDQNPIHTFATPGVYDIAVQITDNQGFIFNDTKTVFVWGEKWAYDIGSQMKPQIPAIDDNGTIYIGSEDNTGFHAINPDGTLKWIYSGLSDNVYSSASIGTDGTIYVGAKDNNLHAINPDGTQKWVFAMGGDAIYATPAIANDGTIYIGSDSDNLFAINPDGTQKWVFNTAGFNIRSTPAIATDGTVYIASDDDNLYALNSANGSVVWSFLLGGDVEGGLAIDSDGSIIAAVDVASSQGAVFAINPDGTEKWSTTVGGRILSSPAIANNTIYFGTKDISQLIALNATNGSQLWSFTAGDIILSSPTIDINGAIYFGSFDDNIYVLNPDGTQKYKFDTGANVWSSGVIGTDGTLYIGGYDNMLHAFEFFADGLANDVWPTFGKNNKHTSR